MSQLQNVTLLHVMIKALNDIESTSAREMIIVLCENVICATILLITHLEFRLSINAVN